MCMFEPRGDPMKLAVFAASMIVVAAISSGCDRVQIASNGPILSVPRPSCHLFIGPICSDGIQSIELEGRCDERDCSFHVNDPRLPEAVLEIELRSAALGADDWSAIRLLGQTETASIGPEFSTRSVEISTAEGEMAAHFEVMAPTDLFGTPEFRTSVYRRLGSTWFCEGFPAASVMREPCVQSVSLSTVLGHETVEQLSARFE